VAESLRGTAGFRPQLRHGAVDSGAPRSTSSKWAPFGPSRAGTRMEIVEWMAALIRRTVERLGPYLLIEILLPGGSLLALLLFLYRRYRQRYGWRAASGSSALPLTFASMVRSVGTRSPTSVRAGAAATICTCGAFALAGLSRSSTSSRKIGANR